MLAQCDYNGSDTEWNDLNLAPEGIAFDSLKMELEQAFGGECEDSDDDESDDPITSTTLFNYKEKSFTEDDITDFVSKSVLITIPDEMRERKCDACKQRFMLKESFDQHLKDCIELKLNKFVMEGYQLLSMRKSRALSANEFNRRMIFALKKMVKSLTLCYKEVSDGPNITADDKITKKNNLFDSYGDSGSKKSINNELESTQLSSIRLPNLLSSLEGKPNVCIQKNHLLESCQHGINASTGNLENFINSPLISTPVTTFKPIDSTNGHDDFEKQMLTNIERIAKPTARVKRRHPTELNTIVAQCSQCNQSFSSLQQFEEHIRKQHTNRTPQPSSNVSFYWHFFMTLEEIKSHLLYFHLVFYSIIITLISFYRYKLNLHCLMRKMTR